MSEMESFLQFAHRLADAGRALTLARFRGGVETKSKTDRSPVTEADIACEKKLREMLADAYPTHAVVGEEFGAENLQSDIAWIIDPIDGTRSFISGSRQYCSLIALAVGGKPALGLIDMPALDERWWGVFSPTIKQAFFNGKPCNVAPSAALSAAVMATTTMGVADGDEDDKLRRLCNLAGHVRLGGDASAFGCVASGFSHMAADYAMAPYDYLPLAPIIKASGGVITDWEGRELFFDSARAGEENKIGVLASASDSLQKEALSALANGD